MLSTYLREIRHDFAVHAPGLRWESMWRRRQWQDLLWHIDHLPRNSFYHEAMATDKDLARQMIREGAKTENFDPRPAVSEFGLAEDLLTTLVNEVRHLQASVVAIAGGGNPKVDVLKGPRYAITEIESEVRKEEHYGLAARLVPHRYPDQQKP